MLASGSCDIPVPDEERLEWNEVTAEYACSLDKEYGMMRCAIKNDVEVFDAPGYLHDEMCESTVYDIDYRYDGDQIFLKNFEYLGYMLYPPEDPLELEEYIRGEVHDGVCNRIKAIIRSSQRVFWDWEKNEYRDY